MLKPFSLILFVLISSCTGNQPKIVAAKIPSDSTEPRLQKDCLSTPSESLVVHDSLLDLVATKSATAVKNIGQLQLRYKLKNDTAFKEISVKYPLFSDVIFPDTSVAIIRGHHISKSNYFLFNDKKLLLPILGMNFMITYVIDLEKNKEVTTYERRTYLPLVWVDSSTQTFLVTDSPNYPGDQSIVEFRSFVCNFKGNTFIQQRKEKIRYKTEDIFDENLTNNQVKIILKNK
ncbi:hypothetical protein CLV59_109238 [Chitinophaga dinghuensis]|uniref:Lipoprotein n=1 Tax=Chitinophaga dinghuensis TaxID=1539050 RepID=A0A327VLG1_9BACT|nr:hypothetical protein [Chitinophaga dinghuensis]RAJ75624.1 hypothetical protein CLV59_109238 [Chitinophaga dinghuensis]